MDRLPDHLTLAQALNEGRLDEFIGQAEAEGIGPADLGQFEALVGRLIVPQPEDRTSRSRDGGSKRGK